MKFSDVFGVRHPSTEEITERIRQKELEEKRYEESGEKALNELQAKTADCFLNSWVFALAGAGAGLAYGYQRKSYLPLGYGLFIGTFADILSGCYRCQEEWQALQAKYRESNIK